MSDERIFNGVDARTGRYLRAPATEEEFARQIRDEPLDLARQRQYEWIVERFGGDNPNRTHAHDVDPKNLASAGWGVIFAPGITSGIETALDPLLKRRAHQTGSYFKTYLYGATSTAPTQKETFFTADLTEPDPADPKQVPYYLLIVGSPEEIPFRFQYELAVKHAVGRIHFDNEEDYRAYAQNVVEAEKAAEAGSDALPEKKVALFGVSHQGDAATERAAAELIQPLEEKLASDRPGWPREIFLGSQATKAQLSRLLGGGGTPSLLLSASHGMAFPFKDSLQRSCQGALLCSDWPGEGHEPLPEHYLSGNDLAGEANLRGLIAFHFACYSGGTPHVTSFNDLTLGKPQPIAPSPFVSHLAQRLLSHPQGALAVVGHVDRAWSSSFSWSKRGQVGIFENTFKRLLDGYPIGHAMEYFSLRHAQMAVIYSDLCQDRDALDPVNEAQFSRAYRANNDARNFVVLGDPAVRAMFRA
ncbi:MAG TPA: C25 family cysteine peptidase [Thermoanaerobaculia bacterium]|nr:C25 family cysteine peptidase [Thermoanaerobaculia bacterium]